MDGFLDEMERCVPALRRYARALVRDADAADDLVQDCLERALGRRHLWRPTGSVRAWLFTILHNIHANQARSRAGRGTEVAAEAADGALAQPADQDGRLAALDVIRALDSLDDGHRQVILLVALEGLAYREVADVLGIPIGTVMSRLSRGRDRLRALTGPDPIPSLRRVK